VLPSQHTRLAAATTLLLLLIAGCSGQSFAPVEGTLSMNGRPLANVQVEFQPEANGPRSTGFTDQDGKFQLTTESQRPGAVVGMHRVVLYDTQIYDDKPPPGQKKERDIVPIRPARFPARYSEVAKTPLKKEVQSSPNSIELEVTP